MAKKWPRVVLLLPIFACFCGERFGFGQDTLSNAAKERLKERDRYRKEVQTLQAQGKLAEAIAAAQKVLAIEREICGNVHEDPAGTLVDLADMYTDQGDFARARQSGEEALAVSGKLPRQKQWLAANARLALEYVDQVAALEPDQRQRLAKARQSLHTVKELYQQKKYREGLALAREAADTYKQILGENHQLYGISLNSLGVMFDRTGEHSQAVPLFQRSLEIKEAKLGGDHPEVARTLDNLAFQYQALKQPAKAAPFYQRCLRIRETTLGVDHLVVAATLDKLATVYQDLVQPEKAEPFLQRSLAIREAKLGKNHLDVATSLSKLANLYNKMGEYVKAEPLFLRTLEIKQAKLGKEDLDVALTSNSLANLYVSLGEYPKAESQYRRTLEIREAVLGNDHLDVARSLTNLAGLYNKTGEYDKAKQLYQRGHQIYEAKHGKDHPEVARSLNNLGCLYHNMGEYAEAERLLQRGLEIREAKLGKGHLAVASSLNNLANLYQEMGEYAKAEQLYQRSLEIREAELGRNHPEVAAVLNNLGRLYGTIGLASKAEPLYQRSLEIFEKLGTDHANVASSLSNLAILYGEMGQYTKAELRFRRCLAIQGAKPGKDHPTVANSLNNLANVYSVTGQFAKAELLYRRSLKIKEAKLGKDHPNVASSLNNLGQVYEKMGLADNAEPLYRRSLEVFEAKLGKDHPDVASSLWHLAHLYSYLGNYAKAEPLCRRSLEIRETKLGENHPAVAKSLNSLAIMYMASGRGEAALALQERCMQVDQVNLRSVFGFTAEPAMSAYLGTVNEHLEIFVSMVAVRRGTAKTALTWTLRRKAAILDTLCRFRETLRLLDEDKSVARRVMRLRWVRQRLSDMALKPAHGVDPAKLQQDMAFLRQEADQLEGQLNREFTDRHLVQLGDSDEVDADHVQGRISADAALIEVVRVRGVNECRWTPAHYFAFVLTAGNEPPRLIDLGPAEAIDQAVRKMREHVERMPRELRVADDKTLETDFRAVAAELYRLVFAPLRPALGQAKLVYLAADGELNRVAFELLPDPDGHYLVESMQFAYLSSGRDLLRPAAKAADGTVVFAGPSYDLKAADRQAKAKHLPVVATNPAALVIRNAPEPDVRGQRFRALPGALSEAEDVRRALHDSPFGPVQTYIGPDALEEVFKAMRPPRVLHIATHGFFLPDPKEDSKGPDGPGLMGSTFAEASGLGRLRRTRNPLLRSGIVLAGANSLLDEAPTADVEDGWVTAEEIALMDLHGTELVVLSACESGLGDIKTGEGVYGLRRAFIYAGARTLVTSLFKVPDEQTRQMMRSFYAGLKAGKGKLAALHDAQLEMIRQRRQEHGAAHPFFWASFVLVGDPN
jgi:tetratricopeptide (TPR) repeat protein/CHAT domain-containing protein